MYGKRRRAGVTQVRELPRAVMGWGCIWRLHADPRRTNRRPASCDQPRCGTAWLRRASRQGDRIVRRSTLSNDPVMCDGLAPAEPIMTTVKSGSGDER